MVAISNPFVGFDPALAEMLRRVFHEAWTVFERSEPDALNPATATAIREALALRLIDKATRGEHDQDELRTDAVLHVRGTMLAAQIR
jgi:hypothetical protein